jgi:hypothetical protein
LESLFCIGSKSAKMFIVFGYAQGPYPPMPPKLPAEQVFFRGQYQSPNCEIMESWLSQMIAGYKAGHLRSSFENQVRVYQNKIVKAEADLREMVFIEKTAKLALKALNIAILTRISWHNKQGSTSGSAGSLELISAKADE